MQRWDIFCRIVDNYGDIGICWRLARQLKQEYRLDVRLWVDDLSSAAKLIPRLNTQLQQQSVDGVNICHWQQNFAEAKVADVVIEAFACELPEAYLAEMARSRPVWLNLEYLSAENWVQDFHLQSSPHPKLPLTKYFFFPGFTEKTGGLLREPGLIEQRDDWQSSAAKREDFWHQFGVISDGLKISLFCYPHAPVESLLASIVNSEQTIDLLVPQGAIVEQIANYFGLVELNIGDQHQAGKLRLHILPFLSQDEYDHLLWSCDLNFVRGEDSWVRAIWAVRPFIWQPYQQEGGTHFKKLEAFLDLYAADQLTLQQAHHAWLSGGFTSALWDTICKELNVLKSHTEIRSQALQKHANLTAKLVIFVQNRL
jgi:uncharacterized repeat protein (TIGR03837 family)